MERSSALTAARSSSWKDRAAAAEALAAMDDSEAAAALAALRNDKDIAVVRRAAACLLAVPSTRALERFTGAYAVADDQFGDAMNDELSAAVDRNPPLRSALLGLAEAGDAGARSALAWLG